MTLLRLLKQARRLYPLLSWYDLLIAGLEELISQNTHWGNEWHRAHHIATYNRLISEGKIVIKEQNK